MSTPQTLKKKKSFAPNNWQFILIGIFCLCYIPWAIWYWQSNPEKAGQFGDMFGVITALIGTLSVVLLIQSLRLQRRELHLARKEYKLGLEEMQKQTQINETNKETAKLQRFETTYFNMLDLVLKAKDELSTRVIGTMNFNSEAISSLATMKRFLGGKIDLFKKTFPNGYNQSFHKTYRDTYSNDEVQHESYFKPIVSLVRLLIFARLDHVQNKMYFDIYTSLLSPAHFAGLFWYFSLSKDVLPAERKFILATVPFRSIFKTDFIPDGSYSKMLEGAVELDELYSNRHNF